MKKDTLTLVCAKHGIMLIVNKQKVPGQVEVVPCPGCIEDAYQKEIKKEATK